MKENKSNQQREESVVDLLDAQYLAADNQQKINYWKPFARIIMEAIEARDSQNLSQADLAARMKTKQSVISRFENMGRLPSYDFIARLSIALGHAPGITLHGEYMTVVPPSKQGFIQKIAKREKIPTWRVVEQILEKAIDEYEAKERQIIGFDDTEEDVISQSSLDDLVKISVEKYDQGKIELPDVNQDYLQYGMDNTPISWTTLADIQAIENIVLDLSKISERSSAKKIMTAQQVEENYHFDMERKWAA